MNRFEIAPLALKESKTPTHKEYLILNKLKVSMMLNESYILNTLTIISLILKTYLSIRSNEFDLKMKLILLIKQLLKSYKTPNSKSFIELYISMWHTVLFSDQQTYYMICK